MTPLRAALADVGRINDFFRVEPDAPGEDWESISRLWRDPRLLALAVARTRDRMAGAAGCAERDVEWRVAASVMYQGLASRLLSPLVGAAVCHGRLPDARALSWRFPPSGSQALALAAEAEVGIGADRPGGVAEAVHRHALLGVLAPVHAALREQGRIAPLLLWGNAASSLAGTARALAEARPGAAEDAFAVAQYLLDRAPLRGLGSFAADPRAGFSRMTCCLYYRVPGAGKCGDCCLVGRGGNE